jgi:hypothetical protein
VPRRTVTVFTFLALPLLAPGAGCLPEGDPGVGEALVSQRGLGGLLFAKGPATATGGLLYSHRGLALGPPDGSDRGYYGPPEDLYFIKAGAAPHRLLQDYAGPAQWDATGRLYIGRGLDYRSDPATHWNGSTHELWRFELDTLASLPLGRMLDVEVSEPRTRVYYRTLDFQGMLRTLDDQEFPLGRVEDARFVGNDLYYVEAGALKRLREPGEPPVTLMSGSIDTFRVLGRGKGHALLETRSAGNVGRIALIDTTSDAQARVLGASGWLGDPALSTDGGKLAWMERATEERGTLRILDLPAGTEAGIDLALPPRPPPPRFASRSGAPDPAIPAGELPRPEIDVRLEFRPGSDELWCFFSRELRVFAADGKVRTFPLEDQGLLGPGPPVFVDRDRFNRFYFTSYSPGSSRDRPRTTRFSSDGRFWTLVRGGEGHLGEADRPDDASTIRVFAEDEYDRSLLDLEPGRRVAFWAAESGGRRTLFLADLEPRQLRVVARNVGTVQIGRSRAVVLAPGLSRFDGGPGDLSVVDLETGAANRLAQNVTSFALDPACTGCDPTEAGARLVYVVHARVPWKYDGLWSASLP